MADHDNDTPGVAGTTDVKFAPDASKLALDPVADHRLNTSSVAAQKAQFVIHNDASGTKGGSDA